MTAPSGFAAFSTTSGPQRSASGTNMQVNIGDVWKPVSEVHVNSGGSVGTLSHIDVSRNPGTLQAMYDDLDAAIDGFVRYEIQPEKEVLEILARCAGFDFDRDHWLAVFISQIEFADNMI